MTGHVPRNVEFYVAPNGAAPLISWLESIRDIRGRARIKARIARLELGNFGQCRSLEGGISELKITYGPGYRVYFARPEASLILLLCGGTKGKQKLDIERARRYWRDYQERQP